MTVPFRATSMDSAMPAETMAAPHAPTATAVASDAGRCEAAMLAAGEEPEEGTDVADPRRWRADG